MGRKKKPFEIEITDTAFPGYGVGLKNEEEVYIKNALPGQKLLVIENRRKKGHMEARILETLEDANYKVQAPCPHFYQGCGGCTHQYLDYEKQLEFKKNQVLKLFEKKNITGFEFEGIEGSPEMFHYRNKMEFTFGDMEKGGEITLGLHARGMSFGILTVDQCYLVEEDYRTILKETLEYVKEKGFPKYRVMSREGFMRNLIIRQGKNTRELMINVVTTSQLNEDFIELKERLLKLPLENKIKGILHTINDSFSDAVKIDELKVLYGQDYITENLLGLNFKISPLSFFQTNSKGAEKLYSIVKEYIGESDDKVVFDLYCGTGTIGQIVAPKAKKVIGLELIEEAVKAAEINAELNGLTNCKFIAGDVAETIKTIKEKPDTIILDPPRAGVSSAAMKYVIDFDAKNIVYVSCNPESLVVNLKELEAAGYRVDKVRVKDMFPHTPHVETVVRLQRKHS
ncbi:23S rRNA (uracil(1939)-C(5))-methyltransferase RlmD [Clostridium cellulovorans]|uniref:RNA methyltransferase, TrmA family n=1 Tax=Clostridium cellulovorans (strain ATCC 35296 / DSM 3052 / OCM 3 / 743B) TaxID=573061 RepID=D9SRC8_CLOC7|nr:23S rRNA (uracil(1939)-C(5))-methyltransferase RlmD [Clostridium cellulovorans]ADL52357.1 RNA methyltransferase, TrmA family [Clostridium cellulovorans 743B]